jgi:predicted HAD superfamily Cof-like phosphohydrolase
MTPEQRAVRGFHRLMGQDALDFPSVDSPELAGLSIALIAEEFNELIQAVSEQDIVGVADALGDLLYVVNGAGLRFGLDLEPIFNEIHRSNMAKVHEDGTVHYREDGKVLKPEGWQKPQLEAIVNAQLEAALTKVQDDRNS